MENKEYAIITDHGYGRYLSRKHGVPSDFVTAKSYAEARKKFLSKWEGHPDAKKFYVTRIG